MDKLAQVDIGTSFGSRWGMAVGGSSLLLSDLITLMIRLSFMASGVIVLFLFGVSGFYIIMGAGQENPEDAAKGKKAATAAGTGFAIIFVAYWIIRLIEVIAGRDFITQSIL